MHNGVLLSSFELVRVLAIDTSQWIENWYLEPLQKFVHLRYLQLRLSGDHREEIAGPKLLQTLV